MKYFCAWLDNAGFAHPLRYEASDDSAAVVGLIQRCRDEYETAPGVVYDGPLRAIPFMLIREDFELYRLSYGDSEGTEVIRMFDSEGETLLRTV